MDAAAAAAAASLDLSEHLPVSKNNPLLPHDGGVFI